MSIDIRDTTTTLQPSMPMKTLRSAFTCIYQESNIQPSSNARRSPLLCGITLDHRVDPTCTIYEAANQITDLLFQSQQQIRDPVCKIQPRAPSTCLPSGCSMYQAELVTEHHPRSEQQTRLVDTDHSGPTLPTRY